MSLRKGSESRLTLAEDWSNINLSVAGSREVGQNVDEKIADTGSKI